MAAGTPATVVLTRAKVPFRVHSYEHHHGVDSFGAEAAAALGVDPRRLFKTLIASVDGSLHCAVVPVAGHLDLKALARAVGGKKAALADAGAAQRATGYVLGGISPLGQRSALPVTVDASAQDHATIYCSAGRRGLQLEVAPAELIRLTGAKVAAIATD